MSRALLLMLWGWTVVWSWWSGRLDLLLKGVFHGLVGAAGLLLLSLGLLMLFRRQSRRERLTFPILASAAMAVTMLVLPPTPSFSDLASTRPEGLPEPPELAFVLPPEQRTLTEWVRLLRTQPDPSLHEGAPLTITGFVFQPPEGPPQLARLMVRCCLADATPTGLPVQWRATDRYAPDTWLRIRGMMAVDQVDGVQRNVVKPTEVTVIPRPERPLEP